MAKAFYISTAIDYPTAKPHLGHAFEKIGADCMARWHRLKGEKVLFSNGLDEHGQKNEKVAREAGLPPKEFVDQQAAYFQQAWAALDISTDSFIRTSDPEHMANSQKLFKKVFDKKLIYKGNYSGKYCVDCERFYTEKELVQRNCPVHGKSCQQLEEETYFFKMGNFQKKLQEYISKNKEFIRPETRRQEILSRLKIPLKDLSVSRASVQWGIPLPNDSSHTMYVWFDALANYLTAAHFGKKDFKNFWPCDVHVVGKDILWFHAVIWPCMLYACDIPLPKSLYVHGFVNLKGSEKMSKSLGNIVDPLELVQKYGSDSVRYFLLREIPFGEDGEYSEESLKNRHNLELANEFGNLVNRAFSMLEKYNNSKIPSSKTDKKLAKEWKAKEFAKKMDSFQFHMAAGEAMQFAKACNKFVNEKEPWKLKGKERDAVLYSLMDSIRVLSIALSPFIPRTCDKVRSALGVKELKWKEARFNLLKAGTVVRKPEILFNKVE
ncbi:MAG: methionine--tRNA ligase [Candidatus Diapherotrites archaeon]